jgi:hypothetical protein
LGYILGDFVTNSPLVTLNMESGGKKLLSQLVLETKNFRRRREEKKAASLLLPGVDVMITIFCDFFGEKIGVFLQNQCYDQNFA